MDARLHHIEYLSDIESWHSDPVDKPDSELATPVSLQGRYRFVKVIGQGAQARIYLAERLSDNTRVAIKQLNIGSVKNWKAYDLFHREAEVLSKLNIKGVAKFYEAVECLEDDPPCSYIVQEYIEGTSLNQLLKKGHRFEVREVYDILIQLAGILDALHHQKPPVIHRDIKPSNIMLSRTESGDLSVKLIDFGAVANPQVQGGGSTVAGTFGYMPPEQLMGKTVPASDIYALAAVAVHIFSGKSPADLPSKDFRLIFEPSMEQMPPELLNTLRKMLEPKVDERLCDVDEIIRRFKGLRDNNYRADQASTTVTKDLDGMLKKVRYVGEPGNMDIWQGLSDITPRSVPKLLYYNCKQLDKYDSFRQLNDYVSFVEMTPDMSFQPGILFYLLWVIVTVVLFALIFVNNFSLLFVFTILNLVLGVILFITAWSSKRAIKSVVARVCLAVSIPFAILCIVQPTGLVAISYSTLFMELLALVVSIFFPVGDDENKYLNAPVDENITPEKYNDVLRNGRKMIATIVDVKYMPANPEYLKCIEKGYYDDDGGGIKKYYKYFDDPKFVIRYKFNPPDDENDNDVIHQCVVHTEPENHYKPGDPLPILYLNACINSSARQVYGVYSMVFPFPHEDSIISNLLCFTPTPINLFKNEPECRIRFNDNDKLNYSTGRNFAYLNTSSNGSTPEETAFNIFFGGDYEASKYHINIDDSKKDNDALR